MYDHVLNMLGPMIFLGLKNQAELLTCMCFVTLTSQVSMTNSPSQAYCNEHTLFNPQNHVSGSFNLARQ